MQTGLHTECCMSVGDSKYFRRESPRNIFVFFHLFNIFKGVYVAHVCTTASDAGYIRKKAAVLSGGLLYMQENDVNIK